MEEETEISVNLKENKKLNKDMKKSKVKVEKKKENNYLIKISDEIKEKVIKLNLKIEKVFCLNNKINISEEELITYICIHDVLKYECNNKKCSITNEWNGEPIKLLLVRKNNKDKDLRIKNLEFKCYNCYFQENNNNIDIFKKIKKAHIPACKLCNYSLCNISNSYRNLGICKVCINKNNKNNYKSIIDNGNLFMDTFDNSLSSNDLESQFKNTNTIDDIFLLLENNNVTQKEKQVNNKQKTNPNLNTNPNTNLNPNPNIKIKMEDINIEELNEIKNLVN